MTFLMSIYHSLVDPVPGIKERYQQKRKKYSGQKKLLAWLYLLGLNIQYYIFRKKKVGESRKLHLDLEKKIYLDAESGKLNRLDPEKMAGMLEKFDIISFDVFDTLLLRKLSEPTDLFYLLQKEFSYLSLKKLRQEAEWKSREERYKEFGDYEVTLSEIWEELSKKAGIDSKQGAEREFQLEEKICYANPYFKKVVDILLIKKKKIIICSDMYLGKERIKKLLLKSGYPEFEDYFISSDLRKSKYSGELYRAIREKYGEKLRCIHIGDNEFSDIKMAKANGFEAFLYDKVDSIGSSCRAEEMNPILYSVYSAIINGYLHNGTIQESREFEFGFIYGGLFAVGFCQFIHSYVKENHIEAILFLARDGEILKKVYEYLYPKEKEICKYAYWSRLASAKLSAKIEKSYFMERMLLHKIGQGYSFTDIFKTMDAEELLPLFIEEFEEKHYKAENKLTEKNAADLQTFLNRHWEEICNLYEEEIEEGKKYYSQILGKASKVVAVDAGWVGSGPLLLNKIAKEVWHFQIEITGLLGGCCSANNPDYESCAMVLAEGRLVSYLFSASFNREIWKKHDASKGHNMIVELLLSSEEKSFRGFKKDEKGNYSFNRKSENIRAAEIQRGILKFAELYREHPLGHLQISGSDAAAPIALLYENPEYIKKQIKNSKIRANIE